MYNTIEKLKELERGDIIKSKTDDDTYLVDSNFGNKVVAVKTFDITNLNEWDFENFSDLKIGQTITHIGRSNKVIITDCKSDCATGVRTIELNEVSGWLVFNKEELA